jgi:hypothetical protein
VARVKLISNSLECARNRIIAMNAMLRTSATKSRRARSSSRASRQLRWRLHLFDHLIGQQKEGFWNLESERLGGPEVDDQLEFGWLQHWQVGWLLAPENAARKSSGKTLKFAADGESSLPKINAIKWA